MLNMKNSINENVYILIYNCVYKLSYYTLYTTC